MIFSPVRKAVIAGASVLAVGAAGGVAVHAATSGGSTNASLTATSPSPSASPNAKTCVPGPALGVAHQVLAIAVKDTGLTQQQILDQLRAGKTFDQIAGSKAQTVENDVLAALKTHLDQAVSSGRMTSDRETAMLAKAKTAIEKAMSSNLSSRIPANGQLESCGKGGRHGDGMGGKVLRTLISVTAQQTGLTEQQVMQDLRNGESIDQIAGSKAAAIKAAVLQQLQQDLSKQLDEIMSHSGGFGMGHGGHHGAAPDATPSSTTGT
jgi:uncharacterized protein (DUF433 family)